jgi:hypothetical protein
VANQNEHRVAALAPSRWHRRSNRLGIGCHSQSASQSGIGATILGDPDAVPEVPAAADVYVKARRPVGARGPPPPVWRCHAPYGVSLDPTWRDRPYNRYGRAESGYLRIAGHRNTTLSGDTRVDWSEAFALVPSLQVGYVWHAGVHAGEVAAGLVRIGFEIVSQVIWDKGLFAMGRSWYHWGHEPCWVVRKPGIPHLFHGERDQGTIWRVPSPKMIMGGSSEEKQDHPTQKPVLLAEIPIRNHLRAGGAVYDPFVGSGTTLVAAQTLGRSCYALEIEPRFVQVAIERWQRFSGQTAVRIDG